MCVQVLISTLDRRRGGNLTSEVLATASGLNVSGDGGRLELTPTRDCGCGFVVGDVVSGDWTLERDFRQPLARAVQVAGQHTKKFRFSATWMGDPAPEVENLSVEDLVRKIEEGDISGRYLYVVSSA